jgi:hypothetical protein
VERIAPLTGANRPTPRPQLERIAPPPGLNWSESPHARGVPLVNLGLLCRAKAEDVFVRFSAENPSIVAADWGLGQTNVLEKRNLVRDLHGGLTLRPLTLKKKRS